MAGSLAARQLGRRKLGRTGLEVSPLGLAAFSMRFGAGRGGRLSADDVERAFYEHGINTFLVHYLMTELCAGVRRLVRSGHRDQLVLVSEVGLPWAGSVCRGLERHLRLLETDHLDVWLLGWVRKRWYVRSAVWSEMERLRGQGKTRAIGLSSHDRLLAAALARSLPADVLMIRYNAAHRGAEREVFAPLTDLGDQRPGIIAYTATRWGMLLKPLPKHDFPQGLSGAECYRFALGHPAVDTVWCGARSAAELAEDVEGALLGPLDAERRAAACRFGDAVHRTAVGGFRWMFGPTSE